MIEELLNDPIAKAAAGFVVLPLVLLILLAGVVVLLRYILRESPEIEAQQPYKYARYEAGNPEKGEARARVSMQYLGYLIIFLALEPAVVLVALTMAAPGSLVKRLAELYIVMLAVYIPLLTYAVREARRIGNWMIE